MSALAAKELHLPLDSPDPDWQGGECVQVEFEGSSFGAARAHRVTSRRH